uniref:Uncharacterized protein n=1 Tax=Arundo donax TaxID=35708 RepID=A0A0A9A3R7_ARUDO
MSSAEDMDQVNQLLKIIGQLKKDNLTAIAITSNFALRQFQPLKAQIHPSFEYQEEKDPTREGPMLPSSKGGQTSEGFLCFRHDYHFPQLPNPFNLRNPPLDVCIIITRVFSLC